MPLLRSPKSLKLLSLVSILHLAQFTTAQVAGAYPDWLPCIRGCQPLWSANYDCTQAGESSADCLCQSGWVQQFYDGNTCSCDDSEEDAEMFRNWFGGSQGVCYVYVQERLLSSSLASKTRSSTRTETTEIKTTESSSSTRITSRRPTTSAPTSTSATTTSGGETTITSNASTLTTRISATRSSPSTTAEPTLSGSSSQADNGFITEENKKWVIPTIAVGSLIVLGSAIFAVLFFCFGCCRRSRRGKYSPTNNPTLVTQKKKKSWLSFPFFGRNKSNSSRFSESSQDMGLMDKHQNFHDTAYYGAAGNGRYPPPFVGNNTANSPYVPIVAPYEHGAPLPPIDEVRSIAESTRGMPNDDDDHSAFSFENSAVSGYTPVNNGTGGGGGFMPAPMPAMHGHGGAMFNPPSSATAAGGAGLVGAGIPSQGRRDSNNNINSGSFPNRYEDLSNRRSMDRRMFNPITPQGSLRNPSAGGGMSIPRKEVPSPSVSPVGNARPEQWRNITVSPPASTVSSYSNLSQSSSGFAGGGGPLAGRGAGTGSSQGFPQAPPPTGSAGSPRRGEYYEDYRSGM